AERPARCRRDRGGVPGPGAERGVPALPHRGGRGRVGGRAEVRSVARGRAAGASRTRRGEGDRSLPAVVRVMRGPAMETRILIVDDDPFICRQLEELYSSQQYAVSSASNSQEALRVLNDHEFSLAVVDLKIPGTDGIGLTREIRDRWPDLDVIMI